jgi:hypothetical protein
MLLAMDVGNTETVIGLFGPETPETPEAMGFARATDERGLAFHWRISTDADRTPDEHAMVLTQLLDLEGLDLRTAVTAIAISSSSPMANTQLRRMANRWFSALDFTVIGPGTKSGMPILYDNPREVGPDVSPTPSVPTTSIPVPPSSWTSAPPPSLTSSARRGSTSVAPSRPVSRSRSTPSTRTPRHCARSNSFVPAQ